MGVYLESRRAADTRLPLVDTMTSSQGGDVHDSNHSFHFLLNEAMKRKLRQ